MKDKFNLLYKSSSSKQMIQEEETDKLEKDQTFERRKRKHNEIESPYISDPLQSRNSTYSTCKLILKPVDTDKKESLNQTYITSDNTKIQAFETLEKYLTMDERYIEMDKNIGTNFQSK
jgi:hypothetical protein